MSQAGGGWTCESDIVIQDLQYGMNVLKYICGASSHELYPYIVISLDKQPVRYCDEAFALILVYEETFSTTCKLI